VIEEHTELFSPDLGFGLGRRSDDRNGAKTTVRDQTIRPLDRKPPF
jgi:hypothetical protein